MPGPADPPDGGWDHNRHYERIVLEAVPEGCRRALDVGCGEGSLARALRRRVPEVVAIDADAGCIDVARGAAGADGIDFLVGDFMTQAWAPGSFDLVAAVASLHHMDERAALARMRDLLRPGGALAVVGLARSRHPADFARDAMAVPLDRGYAHRRGRRTSSAPVVWPPPRSYGQMRDLVGDVLPGARFRRHLLFRFSVVWNAPLAF